MAKTANLLTDGYGGPDRIGLCLPLHWQTLCLLLGGLAAGGTVVVAREPAELAGCSLAFVAVEDAEAALEAGVDDVLACSLTPLAGRLDAVPPMVLDAAAEIPGYGDRFGPPRRTGVLVHGGEPVTVPVLPLGPADRVLTALDPRSAHGLAAVLGVLRAGAALVLLAGGEQGPAMEQERATGWFDERGLLQVREGV